MGRPVAVVRDAVTAIRKQLLGITRQSERTLLLGTVLLASVVSAATGIVLTQYFGHDVFSSLLYPPEDCWRDMGKNLGRHCFGDYAGPVIWGMQPNLDGNLAAVMVPFVIFGFLGKWPSSPQLAAFGYLFALTIAVLTPALWAARGARGLERVVVFVACGAAAIPAWVDIDRGNLTGFVVPIALVFLVALCRQRWDLVTIMVILATLVKPQFAVLGLALFAARQWRLGGIAVVGVVISNLSAYLLWPRDFPDAITQSIHRVLAYGGFFDLELSRYNISFGKGLLLIPDFIKARETGGVVPEGFLGGPRSLIGYGVLVLVVVSMLALGRRIPPVMVGIVLLPTASLFPAVTFHYYLVFVLPVAALVARDPDGPPGSGIFDRLATLGDRRRAIGICVSLATALSIAQVALPHSPTVWAVTGQRVYFTPNAQGVVELPGASPVFVDTTAALTPLLWLIACAAIIVSYLRRPAPGAWADLSTTAVLGEPTPAVAS